LRWSADPETVQSVDSSGPIGTGSRGPAQARRRTATAGWQAILVIDQGEDAVAAAHLAAAGQVLEALAKTSAADTRKALREAAFAFERASRSHIPAERRHGRALRRAARDLVRSGPALGGGKDGATTAMLIDMAFFLVTAAAHWHGKNERAQQAAAAWQAAEHQHAAYQAAVQQPIAVLHQRGRQLSAPRLRRQATLLRRWVPELAEHVLAEPGRHALAATLADAEAAGYEPAALLREPAARRELDTADAISDVLVWRLRRMTHLPAAGPPGAGGDDVTCRRLHDGPQRNRMSLALRPGSSGTAAGAARNGNARRGSRHRIDQIMAFPAPPAPSAPLVDNFLPPDLRMPSREELTGMLMPWNKPLVIGGEVRTCPKCDASRDWIIISMCEDVWLRCRAGQETLEHRLDTAWFKPEFRPHDRVARHAWRRPSLLRPLTTDSPLATTPPNPGSTMRLREKRTTR
jgi:hypothetical protein